VLHLRVGVIRRRNPFLFFVLSAHSYLVHLGRAGNDPGMSTAIAAPDDELATLLAQCAQADDVAFRRLYEQQSPFLYGVALRITRQPALASDAVHDALLQVWRNAARYDPACGSAHAWLLSLVRYRALDAVKRVRREVQDVDLPEQANLDPGPLERLLSSEAGTVLHTCLNGVAPDRRRLVLMAFVDGLTHPEIAARVAQPLSTVKSSIRRTLLELRTSLECVEA